MKYQGKGRGERPAVTRLRRPIIGIAIVALVLCGVITVLSIQSGKDNSPIPAQEAGKPATDNKRKKLVTVNEKGEPVVMEDGKVRPLSREEQSRLADGLKQLIRNTDEGLVQIQHKDGSVSMDLDGHFQNVSVAKREADGSITESCINDLENAAAFFEIDPQLLGLASRPQFKIPQDQWPVK